MTIDEALEFFNDVPSVYERLQTLQEVGLGYLELGQSATTLSGGEAQRVGLGEGGLSRAGGADRTSERALRRVREQIDQPCLPQPPPSSETSGRKNERESQASEQAHAFQASKTHKKKDGRGCRGNNRPASFSEKAGGL